MGEKELAQEHRWANMWKTRKEDYRIAMQEIDELDDELTNLKSALRTQGTCSEAYLEAENAALREQLEDITITAEMVREALNADAKTRDGYGDIAQSLTEQLQAMLREGK